MEISFPKKIKTSKYGIQFLCYLWGVVKKIRKGTIVWNLSQTRAIETNLLSFLGLVLRRSYKHKNKVIIIIRDELGEMCSYEDQILDRLFKKYSEHEYKAIKYRYLNLNNNRIDNEKKTLNDELSELTLKHYTSVKVLLSEFMANIDMHTDLKECAISGYFDERSNEFKFSICNMGKTIRQNVKEKGNYEFENDGEAIIWALKKTNTTRKRDESGGLGLYLFRKYLDAIDGDGQIISGKSIIMLHKGSFDKNNINNIVLGENGRSDMTSFFPGTMITINLKYVKDDNNKQIKYLEEFSLN